MSGDSQQGIEKSSRRLRKSFLYAFRGVGLVFKREQNIKIQLIFAVAIVIYGLVLKIGKTDFILLLVVISQVLCLEIVNTGFEIYFDKKDREYDETICLVKDILAASVLISVFFAIIAGLIIFLKPTLGLMGLG